VRCSPSGRRGYRRRAGRLYARACSPKTSSIRQGGFRSRDAAAKGGRPANTRDGDNDAATDRAEEKAGFRHSLAEGTRLVSLERWTPEEAKPAGLLPMICRRGSIDKNDIGAIRIYATHTELEISGQARKQFSVNLSVDKEENIRIEAMPAGPQGEAPSGNSCRSSRGRGQDFRG